MGQGDSILISWNEENIKKIGIIDCNNYRGRNPILEEISEIKEKYEIEFIIISHGHQDHYSGVLGLLDFCKKNNIIINQFISTLQPNQFQYYDITLSKNEKKSITKLIEKINQFYEIDKIILDVFPAYNKVINFPIENYKFECLYPKQSDYNTLGNNLSKYLKGKAKTKPDLNYISTIFKLSNTENYVLLTSDCTKESLNYVSRKDGDIKAKKLSIGQAPHHGSIKNHNQEFWRKTKRIDDCPIVFSVGTSRHNLPNVEVVESFSNMGFKVYSTNYVNGIKAYVEEENTQKDYSSLLDSFSVLYDESTNKKNDRFRGDKKFDLV